MPDGAGSSGVLILGEALGESEALTGVPYQGQAGGFLNRVLYKLERSRGLRREDFLIWNAVACRPPDNKLAGTPWEHGALDSCQQYLRMVVEKHRPKAILATGNVPTQALLGFKGIAQRHSPRRGYVYRTNIRISNGGVHSTFVVPTYHPSFLMQGKQQLLPVMLWDLNRTLDVAKDGRAPWADLKPEHVLHPRMDDIDEFIRRARVAIAANPQQCCAADIETETAISKINEEELEYDDDAPITRVSFAFDRNYGITIPFVPAFLPKIQEIFDLGFEYFVFWNAAFDAPRIRKADIRLDRVACGMYAWHYLYPSIPKALGYVSSILTDLAEWKSKSISDPEAYSVQDSCAAYWNWEEIRSRLELSRRWHLFERHWIQLDPILVEMAQAGVPLDKKEQAAFSADLAAELAEIDTEVQRIVPDDVKPREHKIVLRAERPCERCNGRGLQLDTKALRKAKQKVSDAKEWSKHDRSKDKFFTAEACPRCDGEGHRQRNVRADEAIEGKLQGYRRVSTPKGQRWEKILPFLVTSPAQVKAYIQFRGWRLKTYRGKQSADETALKRLHRQKKDKLLQLVLDYRKRNKLKETYVDGEGYGADRVTTEFTQTPWTLRFASQNPNIQNITHPKRAKTDDQKVRAKRLRSLFIAEPDHVLVELDYSAIEAVMAGWYAGDDDYVAAAKAGIHAILASHVLAQRGECEPINPHAPDAALVKHIKREFPAEYNGCKIVAHGTTYGGSPAKMLIENPTIFTKKAEVEHLQSMFLHTIGKKLYAWQQATIKTAHSQCYLDNAFGLRMYFWDVINPKSGQQAALFPELPPLGTQAKDCLSANPQSSAAHIMKDAILRVGASELRPFLRWTIHDALVFMMPDDAALEFRIRKAASLMSQPVLEMGNLVIDVEGEVGKRWSEMEEI